MKSILIIIFIFLSLPFYGQDFDRLMLKKTMDCSDVSLNCSQLFKKYMMENKEDSAKALLYYWQSKCGLREPIFRAKILLAMDQGSFHDSLLTANALPYFYIFQNRINAINSGNFYSYDNYKSYFGYIPPGQEFDKFTLKLAAELEMKYDTLSEEYLLCQFFSGRSNLIFDKLQDQRYTNTVLSHQYYKEVDKYINLPELHGALLTGVWIPTGEIRKLGVHPQFGFQGGIKKRKMSYDLTIIFNSGKSREEYYARRKGYDTPQLTNYYFGGYIGFDIGRDLIYYRGNELSLLTGIGWDGFDTFEDENKNDKVSTASTVGSLNFNFGLGYRHYFSNNTYIGLRLKYNVVNYTMNDVIDFTGNPITAQVAIGGLFNLAKKQNLNALKYKWRKN
jgi:hypothetical protein